MDIIITYIYMNKGIWTPEVFSEVYSSLIERVKIIIEVDIIIYDLV